MSVEKKVPDFSSLLQQILQSKTDEVPAED